MKFNEKLQKLRKENKFSQEQLADKLEVSRQAVSKWESGTTYPEMDKLIAMCKIFNCSLDDLTNDDISSEELTIKVKNNNMGFIGEILDMVEKSFQLFKRMTKGQIISCLLTMLVVIMLIAILHIPVSSLYRLGTNIFNNFGANISSVLSSIWYFILEVAYFILGVVVFIYIYKIKYLDNLDEYKDFKKIDNGANNSDIEVQEKKQKHDDTKKYEYVVSNINNPFNSIFRNLGKILIFLLKAFLIVTLIPFIISLIALFVTFVLWIGITFKGVLYFGIFFIIAGSILININLIEIIYNFIVNKKLAAKRVFITSILALSAIGVGVGITMINISNIRYIDSIPKEIEIAKFTKEYEMKEGFVILDDMYGKTEYVIDNNLGNKVNLEANYYDIFHNIRTYECDDTVIRVNATTKNNFIFSEELNLIIKDLKNNQVHNYDLLHRVELKIYASEDNIRKIKDSNNKYFEEEIENREQNTINQYESEIKRLQDRIYELESNQNEYETKIQSYKEEIAEYKRKIQDYKDRLKDLFNE